VPSPSCCQFLPIPTQKTCRKLLNFMASFFNSAPGYFLSSLHPECYNFKTALYWLQLMPTPFQFEVSVDQGLHTYLYVAGDNPIVTTNWSGTFWRVAHNKPHSASLTSTIIMQEMAVYLGFVWQLCEEKPSYAIPNYYRDLETINRAGFWSCKMGIWDWSRQTWLSSWQGFIHARACTHLPPSDWESRHKDQAGLFRIDSFERLLTPTGHAWGCFVWGEVCFVFHLRENSPSFLNNDQCPILADFLKPGELFVDIGVGWIEATMTLSW